MKLSSLFVCTLLVAAFQFGSVISTSPAQAAEPELPRVEIPKTLPDHPRLFFNTKEIEAFKAWEAREPWLKKYLDELVVELDKTIDNPTLPGEDRNPNTDIAKEAHNFAIVYVLRGDRRHAEAAAKILRGFTKIMPKYSVAPLKGIVTYATLEECDWAINAASAYDLIYNAGVLSDDDKQDFEQKVLKVSAEVMRTCNHRFRSNWRGRAIAGMALIGFCIDDRSLIDEALHGTHDDSGKLLRDGFVQHISWSILADGVFYERSLHYHLFTADAYAIIAEAARHSGIDLWNLKIPGNRRDAGADIHRTYGPTGEKTMKAIFDSPFYQAFSDYSLTRLGNSYTDRLERKRSYERAWNAYRDPKHAWILHREVEFFRPIANGGYVAPEDAKAANLKALRGPGKPEGRRPLSPLELIWLTPDVPEGKFDLAEDAEIGLTGLHTNFCSHLPNGGITVLRQGADKNDVGVQMTYGDWGSAHTHAEMLAITVCAKAKQMIPEVRYHDYGHDNFNDWDRQTIAHNTVTVDETSQYPQGDGDDRWVVERGKHAHGRPLLFYAGKDIKIFRAVCDVVYDGVSQDRTAVLIDGVLIDFFRCRSQEEHTYDYALHVDGTISKHSVPLSDPSAGPFSKKLGYHYMTQVRRGQSEGKPVGLTYTGSNKGPEMQLNLLSSGATEIFSAKGHPSLEGQKKDVLILRKRAKDVDFVNVIRFLGQSTDVTARRLTDTPKGVLGVELTHADGTVDVVLNADMDASYRYAGNSFDGPVNHIRTNKQGSAKEILFFYNWTRDLRQLGVDLDKIPVDGPLIPSKN